MAGLVNAVVTYHEDPDTPEQDRIQREFEFPLRFEEWKEFVDQIFEQWEQNPGGALLNLSIAFGEEGSQGSFWVPGNRHRANRELGRIWDGVCKEAQRFTPPIVKTK